MGKPSKPRLSTSQSKTSMMNITKHKKKNKKSFDNKIKVFINSSRIINLDDTNQEIANKINSSTPIINLDDTMEMTLKPMHSSTPIKTKSINLTVTPRVGTCNNLTVDLTGTPDPGRPDPPSASSSICNPTVIVLDDEDISGCSTNDSQVTVIHQPGRNRSAHGINSSSRLNLNKISDGINRMTARQKGRLLDMITENIFGGCAQPVTKPVPDTPEVTFIKEVVLGDRPSDTSTGSNAYHPGRGSRPKTGLRMVVIDGSNVAMEHTHGRMFSVKGLKICIDYFVRRGHVVKAFVPRFRCKAGKSTDPRLLDSLERSGYVIYTPSREIQGRLVTSYDDRYIVQTAAEFDGVIVSGDNYRDIMHENAKWKSTIEKRLLPFNWVGDMIMFPKDPLGKQGPSLEQFLKHS